MSDETYQSKIPKYKGHTAGPWRPSEDGKYVEQDREIQYTIASTWHDASVDNRDELEANAALIADAPFLACEVERLREMLKAAVSVLDFFVNGNDLQQAMHDARNVIAKHKKGGNQ